MGESLNFLINFVQVQVSISHRQAYPHHERGDHWDQGDQDVRLGACLQESGV